jgi:outer membrane protein TolC
MRERARFPLALLGLLGLLAPPAHADPPPPVPLPPPPALESLSFEAAVLRALASNPSLAAVETSVQRAEALLVQARAASLPTVSVAATYTRLDGDRELSGRLVLGANQLSANVTLAVPLVAPARWAAWSHARDSVQSARAGVDDARRQLAVAVARAYLGVSSQHRIVATTERALAHAQAHLEFARARLAGGLGRRLDVVRAAQEVAATQSQHANQRLALARRQEALGVLLGAEAPIDAVEDVPLATVPNLADALRDARAQRADVRAQVSRVQAAQNASRDSWIEYLPTLLATAQPFYQNPPSLTQPELGWQAQLVLTVPVYDGGLRSGIAREREAIAREAQLSLEAVVRQARADVRAAFEAIRRADEAAAAAREAAALAAEALELADLAYRAGATTNLDVVDAQRRARDATAAAAMADDEARQARLDLLIASGRFP